MIKISNRLKSLVKYIEPRDLVMDVGCDHALLDIYLVQAGILDHIYIGDVNQNALDNGKLNIEKYDLQNNITPILSYGIEKINSLDVDTLIISGMGSKTIIDILSSPNLNRIYKLVLQSNNNYYELRKFLTQKRFNIVAEEIINDGKKTYINIVAIVTRNPTNYTEKEYLFGPLLIQHEENLDYFKSLHDSYENIVLASKSEEYREKLHMLEEIIEELNK